MKVVHVPRRFAPMDWGGTETSVLNTCKTMISSGHRASIFTPKALCDRGNDLVGNVPVRRFAYFYPFLGLSQAAQRRMDLCGGNLFSFSLLSALNREPDLDVIHAHTLKRLGGICRTAAQKRRIPYLVTVHGGLMDTPAEEQDRLAAPRDGTLEWGRALGWWVGSRRVLQDAAAVVCVGPEERLQLQASLPDTRVEFIPNGVDVRAWWKGDGPAFRRRFGIPKERHVILTVGRIDPQKNQLLLVDLLPALLREEPEAHLLLIGHVTDEAYYRNIRRRVRDSGISRHVTLIPGLGHDDGALVDAYHAADQFVLPSIHEPFGIVVLEAWAASLPVVASALGGLRHLIDDGKTGLLADPARPRDFAQAIRSLAQDGARRRSLAAGGATEAAVRYSWGSVTAKLVQLYERVSDDAKRHAA